MVMATVTLPTSIQLRAPQGEFRNEPFENFKSPETARAMRAALEKVASQLGREYDLVIGGDRFKTDGKIRSLNPAKPPPIVGIHQKTRLEHAGQASQPALEAFNLFIPP